MVVRFTVVNDILPTDLSGGWSWDWGMSNGSSWSGGAGAGARGGGVGGVPALLLSASALMFLVHAVASRWLALKLYRECSVHGRSGE
tara:strand:- start:442 stop:702 length:261 start_codon:yes stop_codon:yes gene_type:complete